MENNGTQPQQSPPTQPVMDIQPPRPATSNNNGWPASAPLPATGVGSAPTPPPDQPSAPVPGMAPAPASWGAPATSAPAAPASDSGPASMAAPSPLPSSDDTTASVASAPTPQSEQPQPMTPGQHPADHNPMASPVHTSAKRKTPVGIIVGTILVALLLAAAAVFAYMKTQDKTASSDKVKVPLIGANDVDQTQKQLEDSLNGVDDATDFAANDLSDTALGL